MILQQENVTEATDVWSYAVVLWELLTREVPFKGINEFKIASMISDQGIKLVFYTHLTLPSVICVFSFFIDVFLDS